MAWAIILLCLSVVSFLWAIVTEAGATTALQQIVAGDGFICGMVALVGAAICEHLHRIHQQLRGPAVESKTAAERAVAERFPGG